jgi:hypothetical protein
LDDVKWSLTYTTTKFFNFFCSKTLLFQYTAHTLQLCHQRAYNTTQYNKYTIRTISHVRKLDYNFIRVLSIPGSLKERISVTATSTGRSRRRRYDTVDGVVEVGYANSVRATGCDETSERPKTIFILSTLVKGSVCQAFLRTRETRAPTGNSEGAYSICTGGSHWTVAQFPNSTTTTIDTFSSGCFRHTLPGTEDTFVRKRN